jgi:signal transduction histidine kinase/ActR/RegA family two-component response regulator
MRSAQTPRQRAKKSKGQGASEKDQGRINPASESHGAGRVASGFKMEAVVAEYRALRASVIRLWRDSGPTPDLRDLDDLTRFNESMDQSLAHAVASFVRKVERDRDDMLAKEQAARGEAEAANRAKDMFLATLSHEIRTPLTPVLAAVTALLQRSNVSRSDRPILEMIRRNIELEARLIEDLLDVTRINQNKLQLRLEPVDLHEAIRDVLDMSAEDAHAKGLKLSSELRARKSTVKGDPARLRQIVWNLVKNAIKFTPSGGLVSVRTTNPESNRLSMQVNDTGVGIAAPLLGKLFTAFEQDEIDRRRYGGLGLGLTISKALVEAHDGTISASSEGKGRGATFTIELPTVAAQASAVAVPPAKPAVQQRKLRILLVEDHSDTARILCKLLETEGHEVKVATTVHDALKLGSDGPLDLLISDIALPDGSGYDILRELRQRAPLPSIALSGYGTESDIKRSREAGFTEHMTKPVDFGRLLRAIEEVTRISAGGGGGVKEKLNWPA